MCEWQRSCRVLIYHVLSHANLKKSSTVQTGWRNSVNPVNFRVQYNPVGAIPSTRSISGLTQCEAVWCCQLKILGVQYKPVGAIPSTRSISGLTQCEAVWCCQPKILRVQYKPVGAIPSTRSISGLTQCEAVWCCQSINYLFVYSHNSTRTLTVPTQPSPSGTGALAWPSRRRGAARGPRCAPPRPRPTRH